MPKYRNGCAVYNYLIIKKIRNWQVPDFLRTNKTKLIELSKPVNRFYEIFVLFYSPVGKAEENDRNDRKKHPNTLL